MKKSGTRMRCAAGRAAVSLDIVIAPEREQIALQVVTERDDLGLEAAAQLPHERPIGLLGIAEHEATLRQPQRASTHPSGRERLDRPLDACRDGAVTDRQ